MGGLGSQLQCVQGGEPATREEAIFLAARGSLDLLKAYLQNCEICRFRSVAADEVDRLEQDELAQTEERTYHAARDQGLASLRAYVSNCKICAYRAAALQAITEMDRKQVVGFQFTLHQNRDLHGGDFQRLRFRRSTSLRIRLQSQ